MIDKKLLETRISKKIIFWITLLLFILLMALDAFLFGYLKAEFINTKMVAFGYKYMLIIEVPFATNITKYESRFLNSRLKDGFLFIDSKPTEKDKNKLVEIFTSEYSLENGYVKFPNDSFGMILKNVAWRRVKPVSFEENQVFHCLQINDLKTKQILYTNYEKYLEEMEE